MTIVAYLLAMLGTPILGLVFAPLLLLLMVPLVAVKKYPSLVFLVSFLAYAVAGTGTFLLFPFLLKKVLGVDATLGMYLAATLAWLISNAWPRLIRRPDAMEFGYHSGYPVGIWVAWTLIQA